VIGVALALALAAGGMAAEPPIRHAHSSSLYDGPKVPLEQELHRLVTATDPSANLATLTEVGSDARTKVLKDAAPGEWGAWVPDGSACCADVGIMWRKADWSLTWKDLHKLTDKVWTDGQGRKHTTYAASAKLTHTSGRTIYLSVAHLPSNVQDGSKFHDNKQAAAWKSAVAGWHDHWNKFRKQHQPDAGLLVADWNIDFHMDRWRDEIQDRFPSLVLNWKGHMPSGGTHGKRLIDATWATRNANKSRLLKDDDSSDHRPYGDAFKW
jgi:hypothetical protein